LPRDSVEGVKLVQVAEIRHAARSSGRQVVVVGVLCIEVEEAAERLFAAEQPVEDCRVRS